MKKLFYLAVFFWLMFWAANVTAQDLSVTCDGAGNCISSPSGPLFPASETWFPGENLTKRVRISNISLTSQTFGTRAKNNTATGNLDQIMGLSIYRVSNAGLIWSGTLFDFYGYGELDLGIYSSGAFEDYYFTVTMPISAGNEYQNQETKFDLLLGFLGTSAVTTTTAAGGGVAGAGVSTPTCSDQAPGSAPILISATPGINSVVLTWSEASNPVSYYLVAFGTNPAADQYGNPNVAGKGTTSYTISGLSGGTLYYFKVRAGNGCMPGPFSNILSAVPTGGFVAGVPAGFVPGVLGEQTKKGAITPKAAMTEKVRIKPEVLGTQICKQCVWWPILLVNALIQLLYYWLFVKKGKIRLPLLYTLLISLFAYVVFLWLNKNCIKTEWFCRYFWLLLAGETVPFVLILSRR